jgi:predicted transcriptional regulator
MSLERRRENEDLEDEKNLEESSFRQPNFTPLEERIEDKLLKAKDEYLKTTSEDELTEIEADVLEIAEDILKLKRYDAEFAIESKAEIQKYPIIEKLYAKCISKLSYNKGYSKEEIFLTIRSLEEKNWIVTNERRTKLEILNNERLMSILDFIKKNPGVHARDEKIEKELNITRTPFLKHIITLENFRLLRSKKIGKSLHYFSTDIPEIDEIDTLRVIFLNPLILMIIKEILNDESISISQMGEILDMYSGTIQYHVKKLKKLNLLKSSKNQSGQKIHLVNIELLKEYNKIFKEPDFTYLLKGL